MCAGGNANGAPSGDGVGGSGQVAGARAQRVVVSWSTGKDSAWSLHRLLADPTSEVVGLLTTVTPVFDRVSVHGTRIDVLRAQADALDLELRLAELPYPCPNEAYEAAMIGALEEVTDAWGATHIAFGDLFLEDIRGYREELVGRTPLRPLFPLWGRDTAALAGEMVDAGLQAVIVSAPETSSAADLVGGIWSPGALAALDAELDPCGERGEFHTCVVAGPDMPPLPHRVGEVVRRDGAVYADLILADAS